MEYRINIKDFIRFECKSFIGRYILTSKPKLNSTCNYLNLGCGNNIIQGYINADFFNFRHRRRLEWQLDLRYKLNCDCNVFDGIYSEHTLEHLYPQEANNLLKELYRVLKNGSIIRITVPDIKKYVDFYSCNYDKINREEFSRRFKTGCAAIRNMAQNYLHYSIWDYDEINIALSEAGFKSIKEMSFGVSQDKKLCLDMKERAWETLYVEASK